jgi:hypothetical protein
MQNARLQEERRDETLENKEQMKNELEQQKECSTLMRPIAK